MKTTLFFFLLITATSYSQKLDTLITGIKYKIILFDETEIIGTVLSQDEKSVTLQTGTSKTIIEKDNIFEISKDVSPSKYKMIFSLGAGKSVKSGYDNSYYYNGGNLKSKLSLHGRFSYFLSDNKTIGLDFTYSSFRNEYSENTYSSMWGGDLKLYTILANFQIGAFEKKQPVNIYANLGAGLLISHRNESYSSYYNSYDSTYYLSTYPEQKTNEFIIGLGGGLIVKPFRNVGIYLDAGYHIYSSNGFFIFFGGGYFTIRGGVSYFLF